VFEMRLKESFYCPTFICDVCRKPIEGGGNVLYKVDEDGKPIPEHVWLAHKGQCDAVLERAHGRLYWEELGHFLVMAMHNAGIKYETEAEHVRDLAEIGLVR
jgi:hypothetical protein